MSEQFIIRRIQGDQTDEFDIFAVNISDSEIYFECSTDLGVGLGVNFVIVAPENGEWPLSLIEKMNWRLSVDEINYITTYRAEL